MTHAVPIFSQISLMLALLQRWFAAWGAAATPPARLVGVLTRAEAALAQAIRKTLSEDGLAFPDMDDGALLVWFNENHPGSDDSAVLRQPQVCRLKPALPMGGDAMPGRSGCQSACWRPHRLWLRWYPLPSALPRAPP